MDNLEYNPGKASHGVAPAGSSRRERAARLLVLATKTWPPGAVQEAPDLLKAEHLPERVRAHLLEQQMQGSWPEQQVDDGSVEQAPSPAGRHSGRRAHCGCDVEAALLAELRLFNQGAPGDIRSGAASSPDAHAALEAAPDGDTVKGEQPLVAFTSERSAHGARPGGKAVGGTLREASFPCLEHGLAAALAAARVAMGLLCCAVLLIRLGS